MAETKKTRKTRFTQEENTVLVSEYGKYKNTIESKFSDTLNLNKKKVAWTKMTDAVNSVNPSVKRTADGIKKRWQDIKSATKTKACIMRRETKKTGGGKSEAEELTEYEQLAVSLLGKTTIEGVDQVQNMS